MRLPPFGSRRERNDEFVYNTRSLPGLACRGSARRHFCQKHSPCQTALWTVASRAVVSLMEAQQWPSTEQLMVVYGVAFEGNRIRTAMAVCGWISSTIFQRQLSAGTMIFPSG